MGTEVAVHGSTTIRRCRLVVSGLVQGVGFRPLVYRLAIQRGLHGSVRNDPRGVVIEIEGEATAVEAFLEELADVAAVAATSIPPLYDASGFHIAPTVHDGDLTVHPAPDVATCPTCLLELNEPGNRRHHYPLVTCTTCGPRFTIVDSLPWARETTTMARFALCTHCQDEYDDPRDRRFHAETTACPECGPRVSLIGADGSVVDTLDPVLAAAEAITAGAIVAIKGVGGYHLACDATNGTAVATLRRRKHRDAKPFAVMFGELDAVRAVCHVSAADAALLTSSAAPIVLLRRRDDSARPIASEVAPRLTELGAMLPYTPLQHLLLAQVGRPLVMTSGNATDEPIVHDDADARRRLHAIADLFLAHDRPIHVPCDDSVARVVRGTPMLLRRARGFVPLAIRLPDPAGGPILACGGELKSVFALVRGADAFLSPHLGDLGDARAWRLYMDTLGHVRRLLDIEPRVVAHDLHPGYRTTAWAATLEGVERLGVQHHHAHIASCLADNNVDDRMIGIAWDGTGYGPDGTVWGGEFLVADLDGFDRVGQLEGVRMPGGDAAVREPWRMAATMLLAAFGEDMDRLDLDVVRRLDRAGWRVLRAACERGVNAPLTSSAGRLFDAIASILGVRDVVSFEGQAAMELEALAGPNAERVYPARIDDVDGRLVVRTTDVVRGVADDVLAGATPTIISARFHVTLADVIARVATRVRERTGLTRAALSGGVFQNVRLLETTIDALEACGFEVLRHRQVPPNDGGLALGQAAVAARWLARSAG